MSSSPLACTSDRGLARFEPTGWFKKRGGYVKRLSLTPACNPRQARELARGRRHTPMRVAGCSASVYRYTQARQIVAQRSGRHRLRKQRRTDETLRASGAPRQSTEASPKCPCPGSPPAGDGSRRVMALVPPRRRTCAACGSTSPDETVLPGIDRQRRTPVRRGHSLSPPRRAASLPRTQRAASLRRLTPWCRRATQSARVRERRLWVLGLLF